MLNRLAHLEPKHWGLIISYCAGVAALLTSLHGWSDITPLVAGGFLAQTAALIGAIFSGAPVNPNLNPIENPARRATDPKPPDPLGTVTDATRRNLP